MIRPLLGGGCSECKASDENVGKRRCKHLLCQSSSNALNVLNIIQQNGGEAYLVGGCVRDMVLRKKPHDEDITTSLTPDKVIALFKNKGYQVIPTGLQHGTVTVMMDGEGYEITTFRKETTYSDNRHPDSVTFSTDVIDDCSRRDFTFNAMYFDGNTIIDTFNGQKDIEDRVIRTVGNPDERFQEDALRMLRAVRFSSKLDFEIAPEVIKSIKKNRTLINNISYERIHSELEKTLQGPNKRYAFEVMQKTGLLKEVLPELDRLKSIKQRSKYHYEDAFEHTLSVVDNCNTDDSQILFAALFHDLGKFTKRQEEESGIEHFKGHSVDSAKMADDICKRLKMSNADRTTITKLVQNHDRPENDSGVKRKTVAKYVYDHQDLSDEEFKKLQVLWVADRKAHVNANTESITNFNRQLNAILKEPHRVTDLAINGRDLQTLGYKGKRIGKALDFVLKKSLADHKSDKETLLKYLNEFNNL